MANDTGRKIGEIKVSKYLVKNDNSHSILAFVSG